MKYRVELFAAAVQLAGNRFIEVDCSNCETVTVRTIRENIINQYPILADLTGASMIAVDQDYANPDQRVFASSEIGLIPPVSGG